MLKNDEIHPIVNCESIYAFFLLLLNSTIENKIDMLCLLFHTNFLGRKGMSDQCDCRPIYATSVFRKMLQKIVLVLHYILTNNIYVNRSVFLDILNLF